MTGTARGFAFAGGLALLAAALWIGLTGAPVPPTFSALALAILGGDGIAFGLGYYRLNRRARARCSQDSRS